MKNNLLIGVLGKKKSGRSYTWQTLFGKAVITGKNLRRLYLTKTDYVEVFLINGSAEERHLAVEKILKAEKPRIVLCSLQYNKNVRKTLDFFIKNDYHLFIHWLQPGYSNSNEATLFYDTGVIDDILSHNSMVGIRNGKLNPQERVQEIKDMIWGWATSRGLLKSTVIKKEQLLL